LEIAGMKTLIALTLLLASASATIQKPEREDLVSYTWQYNGRILGTIKIPRGYRHDETENYVEGIVTHIRYGDGSTIILQKGGMYLVPMLQAPEYMLNKTEAQSDRKIRRGKIKVEGEEMIWREDNFTRVESPKNFWEMFPPNIAFDKVPKDRVKLFNESLDSFSGSKK